MKREDILAIYKAGPKAVIKLVNSLLATIAELKGQIEKQSAGITELKERVKSLENQLNKHSRNSNKPPSTDGFIKPKSLRQKSSRPPGG